VNTLVVTLGNYSFGALVRVGVPFPLIIVVISLLLVPSYVTVHGADT
jgi:di/tricarboxylate transporter